MCASRLSTCPRTFSSRLSRSRPALPPVARPLQKRKAPEPEVIDLVDSDDDVPPPQPPPRPQHPRPQPAAQQQSQPQQQPNPLRIRLPIRVPGRAGGAGASRLSQQQQQQQPRQPPQTQQQLRQQAPHAAYAAQQPRAQRPAPHAGYAQQQQQQQPAFERRQSAPAVPLGSFAQAAQEQGILQPPVYGSGGYLMAQPRPAYMQPAAAPYPPYPPYAGPAAYGVPMAPAGAPAAGFVPASHVLAAQQQQARPPPPPQYAGVARPGPAPQFQPQHFQQQQQAGSEEVLEAFMELLDQNAQAAPFDVNDFLAD